MIRKAKNWLWNARKSIRKTETVSAPTTHAHLLYHGIGEAADHAGMSEHLHLVSQENFGQQIAWLKEQGFAIISLEEYCMTRISADTKVCTLTIDDGYASVLTKGLPVLEAEEVPATFFLTTSLLTGSPLWRDKVRLVLEKGWGTAFLEEYKGTLGISAPEQFYKASKSAQINSKVVDGLLDSFLSGRGFEIDTSIYLAEGNLVPSKYLNYGNHTLSHYNLGSLPVAEQALEVESASEDLRRWEIEEDAVFSVPFGNPGTYTDETLALLVDLGFKGVALARGATPRQASLQKKYGLGITERFLAPNQPMPWTY